MYKVGKSRQCGGCRQVCCKSESLSTVLSLIQSRQGAVEAFFWFLEFLLLMQSPPVVSRAHVYHKWMYLDGEMTTGQSYGVDTSLTIGIDY